MPVPGTTTPEQEPFEQVTDAQPPSASITEMCVVLPSRERTSVATVSSASLAGTARGSPRCRSPARNSSSRARLVDAITSAITSGPCGRAEALEDAERVRDQDPARRRRRVGEHLAALVGHPRGLALDHLVRGEVLAREQAAALEHPVAHRRAPRRPRRGSPAPRRRAARAGRPAPAAGWCRPRAAAARPARRAPRTRASSVKIGARTSNRNACIGTTSTPSRAARAGAAVRSPSAHACRSARAPRARPSVVP